ncbi:MAG: MarR family winged helix-turn-helix transcriptional regulator [Acidimicrobiia bacterium]
MDDLHRAARTIALLARMLERAAGDLTLAQYRVLALVAAGDERASLLAGRLAITKPSVSAVVDGLVERGYLAREPVEGDRRAIRLCMTRTGTHALTTAEAAMAERLEPLMGSVDDPASFVQSLDQIEAFLRERFRTRAQ